MGNSQSYQVPPPPPAPAPPVPVVTLPLQRVPTQDGASGLHYSGRVYTNPVPSASKAICGNETVAPHQISDIYQSGISTTSLQVDDVTKRVNATSLESYMSNLIGTGKIPGQLGSFDDQVKADKEFYAAVQKEYCFYEVRYQTGLSHFLELASAPNTTDTKTLNSVLDKVVDINKRLNSLLEIISQVGNTRAQEVNARGPQIEAANKELAVRMKELATQRALFTSNDGVVRTQEEMLRYSAEKNRAMNIQIMFFVAFNIVALGTVMTVYKNTAP
jgi:hypothetical protein